MSSHAENPQPIKMLYFTSDDVTLVNPFVYMVGWEPVSEALDLPHPVFKEGE